MFWYNFLWLVATHHYPVNYHNPYLNDITNMFAIRAFYIARDIIMFQAKNDLPFND